MDSHIKDLNLASEGIRRIEWAESDMPVLKLIKRRFAREKPLEGKRIAACLHITTETAGMARVLRAGGAEIALCASSPLSTQDDVAAALVSKDKIACYAIKGADKKTHAAHIEEVLRFKPAVVLDDGAVLTSAIHESQERLAGKIAASVEKNFTGANRLTLMEKEGALRVPVFAVSAADTARLFDDCHGTGQSAVDGIIRATDFLFAGKVVVVAGYGSCGRGFASRARGLGAGVIVTEIDPLRALEASMDGFRVMTMAEAAPLGDLFCTLTRNRDVITWKILEKMKNGAIVCNAGHGDVEIDVRTLKRRARKIDLDVRKHVEGYHLPNGRRILLLADGHLINLAAVQGHPASVMDMTFAVQALATEYAVQNKRKLERKVYEVPGEIDRRVARLKLQSMGLSVDNLTKRQKRYRST